MKRNYQMRAARAAKKQERWQRSHPALYYDRLVDDLEASITALIARKLAGIDDVHERERAIEREISRQK